MSRIERAAPFLDDGVSVVQDGSVCVVEDPRFLSRPWAVLWIDYVDAVPPEGWFFLKEDIGNRKTILDCLKHGILEVRGGPHILSDGGCARLARVVPE
jgi:hypothetical protein